VTKQVKNTVSKSWMTPRNVVGFSNRKMDTEVAQQEAMFIVLE
jgi:hypothetical protein